MNKDTSSLLDVFDSIEVDNVERISRADKEACENIHKCFIETAEQIVLWDKRLASYDDADGNKFVSIGSNGSVVENCDYSRNIDAEAGFGLIRFSPLYARRDCLKLLCRACETFEERVVSHFNRTYGCDFKAKDAVLRAVFGKAIDRESYSSRRFFRCPSGSFPSHVPLEEFPSYDIVVDYIVESMDGKSFAQMNRELVYGRLKSHIWRDVSRVRNKVKIPGTLGLSWDGESFNYDATRTVTDILAAVRVLFDSPFEARFSLSRPRNDMLAGVDYAVSGSPCLSFKGYKNRALELSFDTEEHAGEFYGLCLACSH